MRSDVSSEHWLFEKCRNPESQLFDWGMMRLRHPFILYGVGDSFAMEADDRQRKKRDAEVLSRVKHISDTVCVQSLFALVCDSISLIKNYFFVVLFLLQRLSRFEEEEKNLIETRKRKFFAEILNAAREFQLQVQAIQKRRKQKNDGVQVWFSGSVLLLSILTFFAVVLITTKGVTWT